MNLLLKIYLAGIIFNLIVIVYNLVKGYGVIYLNKKDAVLFLISSWLVYLLLFINTRKY